MEPLRRFFIVLLLIIQVKIERSNLLFPAETLFLVLSSSSRKHALRYMAYLPNRTTVVIAVYLRTKLTFTAIFFVLLPAQFDTFLSPKNVSETNVTNITPISIRQLEKRTSSYATDAV